ncbi:MAG: helix-turn-helix domain-containing protein [Paludibacteraceae bacterium]|nr:helix-turn-helix domain-containing protein [Paludibacteraceae bacterium]
MSKRDRLQRLIDYYSGGNKTQFANKLGITPQGISSWVSRDTFDIELVYAKCENVSAQWLLTGEGEMLDEGCQLTTGERKPLGIPLLPVEAVAGVLSGNDMQVMEYDCEYFDVPTFKGAEFLIRVTGDSMQPKYYSGDIVACKRLPIDTFFQWNRVYVIGSEQGVILKRVRQGSDAEHITLVSENTDYAPFELSLSKVHSIALVVGVVRAE